MPDTPKIHEIQVNTFKHQPVTGFWRNPSKPPKKELRALERNARAKKAMLKPRGGNAEEARKS